MGEASYRSKIERCIQKMIKDGNLPKGSKVLSSKDKKGYDYIKTPSGQIIFFAHKFDNKIFDRILEGNYRIAQATFNPKRNVIEVRIRGKWKKLETEISKPEPFDLIKHYWDYLEYKGLKYYVYAIAIFSVGIYFLRLFSSIFTLMELDFLTPTEVSIFFISFLVFLIVIILTYYKLYSKKERKDRKI